MAPEIPRGEYSTEGSEIARAREILEAIGVRFTPEQIERMNQGGTNHAPRTDRRTFRFHGMPG